MQLSKYCVILFRSINAQQWNIRETVFIRIMMLAAHFKQNYVPVHSIANRKNKVLLFSEKSIFCVITDWTVLCLPMSLPKQTWEIKCFLKSFKGSIVNNLFYRVFSILRSIMWAKGRLETTENHTESLYELLIQRAPQSYQKVLFQSKSMGLLRENNNFSKAQGSKSHTKVQQGLRVY